MAYTIWLMPFSLACVLRSPQINSFVTMTQYQCGSNDDASWSYSSYNLLLKTGSLDNAIREFSLAKPSWYMSHYTMIYENGERMRDFLGLFVFIVV